MINISFRVNGIESTVEVEERTLLADALRDKLNLTGTHIGCDTSQCGCCTINMDGRAVKSCSMMAVQAEGASITTIEGLADKDTLHPVQLAFSQCHGLQCGFCTPGMITRAHRLLQENPNPTEEEVRFGISGNLCRCTGYQNIVKAVMAAATELNQAEAVA